MTHIMRAVIITPLLSIRPLALIAASALLPLIGCDAEDMADGNMAFNEDAAPVGGPDAVMDVAVASQVVTLRLETRTGVGEFGWSLASQAAVPEAEGNLSIASWDCGARGRWVELRGRDVTFCELDVDADTSDCVWSASVSIGGSDAELELGSRVLAMRDGVAIARLTLLDRTTLAENWYALPIAPFEVVLDVALLTDPNE